MKECLPVTIFNYFHMYVQQCMYVQTNSDSSTYVKINYCTVPLTKINIFYVYSSTYNNLHTYAIYLYVPYIIIY